MLKESIVKFIHALLAIATVSVPAVAAATPVQQSRAVETGDLDLGSDKGRRTLALRIHRVAKVICNAQALESLPQGIRSERKCIQETQASAELAVKNLIAARNRRPDRGG